jgi:O-glycosyl hydrolase
MVQKFLVMVTILVMASVMVLANNYQKRDSMEKIEINSDHSFGSSRGFSGYDHGAGSGYGLSYDDNDDNGEVKND